MEIATSGEEITDECFLTHHAVMKEKRGEAKWRIVLISLLMKIKRRL